MGNNEQDSARNQLHEACRSAVMGSGLHIEYINVSDEFFMRLAQQDEGELHLKTGIDNAPILMWNSLEVKTVIDLVGVGFELVTS